MGAEMTAWNVVRSALVVVTLAAGIIVIRPRRPSRNLPRVEGSLATSEVQLTTVNPWAVAWFIALSLVAGAAQFIAFLGGM